MPNYARSSSKFLYFTKNVQNCNISASVQPISTQFNKMMQNVFLKRMAVRNCIRNPKMADNHHLENRKTAIFHDDVEWVSQVYWRFTILDF